MWHISILQFGRWYQLLIADPYLHSFGSTDGQHPIFRALSCNTISSQKPETQFPISSRNWCTCITAPISLCNKATGTAYRYQLHTRVKKFQTTFLGTESSPHILMLYPDKVKCRLIFESDLWGQLVVMSRGADWDCLWWDMPDAIIRMARTTWRMVSACRNYDADIINVFGAITRARNGPCEGD